MATGKWAVVSSTATGFWKIIEEISPSKIENEASLNFKLAIVGSPEDRARLHETLLTPLATEIEQDEAKNHLREFDQAPDSDTSKAFAFILYAPSAGENRIGVRGKNSVPLTGTADEIVEKILDHRPGMTLALARRFPLFRVAACNRLIRRASMVNARFAMVSSLPGVLPIFGYILPAASVADIVILTRNQIRLVMRLAAAHGRTPAYSKQVKELIGTVGTALGWRTIARELVGLVPAGVGMALKASIAYSGTFSLGKTALWYYQSGKTATPDEIRAVYKNSAPEAQAAVATLQTGTPPDEKNNEL